jgi:hypothetical protein
MYMAADFQALSGNLADLAPAANNLIGAISSPAGSAMVAGGIVALKNAKNEEDVFKGFIGMLFGGFLKGAFPRKLGTAAITGTSANMGAPVPTPAGYLATPSSPQLARFSHH